MNHAGHCYTALNGTSLESCCTQANNAIYNGSASWVGFSNSHNRTAAPQGVITPTFHLCTLMDWSHMGNFNTCIAADVLDGPTNPNSRVWCFSVVPMTAASDVPGGGDGQSSTTTVHSTGSPRLGKVGTLLACAFVAASLLVL